MTRKDFEMIAEAIADSGREIARAKASPMGGPLSAERALEGVATYIADGCKADNPRFDRKRFLAACGFSD